MINDIKIPIATWPILSPISESGVALANVKPVNIAELSKLADELHQVSSFTSQVNYALRKMCKQFDDEFRKILNKHGISEEEWKVEGMIECHCGVNRCFYKGKEIFWYSEMPTFKMEEQTKGTITYYYGEPNDKSNFSL